MSYQQCILWKYQRSEGYKMVLLGWCVALCSQQLTIGYAVNRLCYAQMATYSLHQR